MSDRIVGAALKSLHKSPAQAWTLEELARAAGTSRSVLAERFQHLVGSSPMQYLTQWRMLLASNLLSRSNAPLARIAEGAPQRPGAKASRRALRFEVVVRRINRVLSHLPDARRLVEPDAFDCQRSGAIAWAASAARLLREAEIDPYAQIATMRRWRDVDGADAGLARCLA